MSSHPNRVTILGSGTSTGVPVIGCKCEVCRSDDPKNNRTRASIMVEYASGLRLVVDTGPEFRIQMLRHEVGKLDAVLYTHLHADHCHGFDDLRAFYFTRKTPIECYLCNEFHLEMKERFGYAFKETGYNGTKPQVNLNTLPDEGVFDVMGEKIDTMRIAHGDTHTSVFRFGNFAYATDFKSFNDEQVAHWQGKVDTMVASGIHFGEHDTHSTIPETIELFRKLRVKQGIITHISHKIEHLRDSAQLPNNMQFAYDGMVIDLG